MTSKDLSQSRGPGTFLGLGMLACVACCTVPLLAVFGIGGAALTAFGTYAERAGIVFLGLGVIGAIAAVYRRRRAATSCSVDRSCSSSGCGC